MPRSVLGVRRTPEGQTTVLVRGGWRGVTLERVTLHGDERTPVHPAADLVVSALPAAEVFCRRVELPFGDRAKVEQAAPLEAEESLPLPLEDLVCHIHVLDRSARHARVLLAATPHERVEALIDDLAGHDLTPGVVDVEAAALAGIVGPSVPEGETVLAMDLSSQGCQAAWVTRSGLVGFHALSALPGEPDLLAEIGRLCDPDAPTPPVNRLFLCGPEADAVPTDPWTRVLGLPVEPLPFPPQVTSGHTPADEGWPGWAVPLGLAVREAGGREGSQFNLLQGEFTPAGDRVAWGRWALRAGVYAGVLLTLWGASVFTRLSHLETQHASLKAAIRQTFKKTLPKVTHIVSEPDQMRARVTELETRAGTLGSLVDREVSPLRILREISTRIPKELEVEFRNFSVEENRVRIEGTTTGFDVIDRIRADLAGYPRFASVTVSDAKTMAERNKVLFKITIELGAGS